ncbi:MAG TPA: response regulator [Kofleriaceae bacterium]|nr:response regulator [Kofleriaceae bacterium]
MAGGVATVLAIDDDRLVRSAFRRVLERGGFRVVEAEDGSSGLAAFRERTPDAVLLDLRMPGTDGLDVLSAMVAESPETPVLVVSGETSLADVVQALRRGAWDFVTKPVQDAELLVRAVGRGIEKAQLLRQNREYSESLKEMNERLAGALDELRADERAARQLQFQLLPRDGLRVGSVFCSRRLYPSQLMSGDFVDYFPLGERWLGFYVADVAGHGAASAFVTAILTTLVGKYRESLAARADQTILSPIDFLARLDIDLVKQQLDRHVAMFYGVLDTGSGQLLYASAGAFPYPFLAGAGRAVELERAGRPLNLPGPACFGQGEAMVEPGGRLLLVTDGVLELDRARGDATRRTYADKRAELAELCGKAHRIEDVVAGLALDEAAPLEDDVALLFMRREERHG